MDGYWELFRRTGAPVFYLMYRQETAFRAQARSACAPMPTAADV